ncbi:efflux transporter outer membrane subunit [Sphingomonas sp. BIUV-7]|uniref:Efflux transporter outer membrane subunit n=1 Tax=Sphingomonas natans TaxID=3063330 RepID=A0ABT8Y678_9SPHN|nr:efflux transporter outer membrane subunit [Sphingomonas sp. BIUV-7]MDO6413827.1 efflux transporter outer membrane subunit [Sphingomonas sp. BIUV-7]
MVSHSFSWRTAALLLAAAPALAACVPNLGPAPKPRSASSLASASALPDQQGQWPGEGWWQAYGDPQLDALIAEGLAGSPDIATAAARVARAEGMAQAAGAAGGPTLEANAKGGSTKQSYNNGFPKEFVPKGWKSTGDASVRLGLDLDLFGRNRATRRAALSERDAVRLDASAARLALAASIAGAYADLSRLYAERDVAEQAARIRSESAKLVADRVANGLDTEGERAQANASVPATRADISALDTSIELVRHQLAALVGAGPDRGLAPARPRLAGSGAGSLPANAGIDLVGRRPDVAAARLRVEAADQRVKAAKAAFYPDVSLSALIGVQSLGLSKLVEQDSIYGNAGPALSLPIFDSGRRSGDYRSSRGDYDAAVADYDRVLLGALREVADAVSNRAGLQREDKDVRASLAQSETAYRIARLRYEGGLSTYLSVLTAEDAVVAARRRVADLEARAFTIDVALIRSLGGGFASEQGKG